MQVHQTIARNYVVGGRFMKINVPSLNGEKSWKKLATCMKVIHAATIEPSNNNIANNETGNIF